MAYIFSFRNWCEQVILQRQVKKQADTFIIIYGTERSGKTTLGFNILMEYIKLMRDITGGKYRPDFLPEDYPIDKLWNPRELKSDGTRMERVRWSNIFKNNFASDSYDASKKIKHNPYGAPNFIDEGIDVASWMEQMSREQKGLVHLLKKSSKKLMPTILITPSLTLLNKEMLRRAEYLFMILDEPSSKGNYAYRFKNWKNPIMRENIPFGFQTIQKDILKRKDLQVDKESVGAYLRGNNRMMGITHFNAIPQNIYDLYDKMVKDPLINKSNPGKKYVSHAQHVKLKYMFDTLIFNLYNKDEKTYAQLIRLLTDKFGNTLSTKHTIRSYIEAMSAAEEARDIINTDILSKDDDKVKIEEYEDVDV